MKKFKKEKKKKRMRNGVDEWWSWRGAINKHPRDSHLTVAQLSSLNNTYPPINFF